MKNTKKPEISIVLPTKEEEGAFSLIEKLKGKFGSRAEIIVIDESGDEYYNKLKATGVRAIRQKSHGIENGILEAFSQANGVTLSTIDADGTHDPEGLALGLNAIKGGKADLVLGNRMASLQEGSMDSHLFIGNWMLTAMYNIFFKQHVHDVLTGLFVVDRKAYDAVKDVHPPFKMQHMFFQIELAKRGYRVAEVPINYYKRSYGKSKVAKSKFLFGFKMARRLLVCSNYYVSFMTFGLLGIALVITGLAIAVFGGGMSNNVMFVEAAGIVSLLIGLNYRIA